MVFSPLYGNQLGTAEVEEKIFVWTLSTKMESRKLETPGPALTCLYNIYRQSPVKTPDLKT